MLTSQIAQLLSFIRLAFIATVNSDGTPNVSPKGTLRVLNEEHLFFANIASPNTARNIESNPHVEVNVIDFFKRKGYRFRGTASVINGGSEYENALLILNREGIDPQKYSVKNIMLIHVNEVKEVYSPAYDIGETEKELTDFYRTHYCSQTQ